MYTESFIFYFPPLDMINPDVCTLCLDPIVIRKNCPSVFSVLNINCPSPHYPYKLKFNSSHNRWDSSIWLTQETVNAGLFSLQVSITNGFRSQATFLLIVRAWPIFYKLEICLPLYFLNADFFTAKYVRIWITDIIIRTHILLFTSCK